MRYDRITKNEFSISEVKVVRNPEEDHGGNGITVLKTSKFGKEPIGR